MLDRRMGILALVVRAVGRLVWDFSSIAGVKAGVVDNRWHDGPVRRPTASQFIGDKLPRHAPLVFQ